jgi:hypothetical protein
MAAKIYSEVWPKNRELMIYTMSSNRLSQKFKLLGYSHINGFILFLTRTLGKEPT